MSCPPADTLLLDELGELPVNRREGVRAHVDGCPRCLAEQAALRTMMADLRPAANANDDGPLFSARVLAAARSTPQEPRAIPRRGTDGGPSSSCGAPFARRGIDRSPPRARARLHGD